MPRGVSIFRLLCCTVFLVFGWIVHSSSQRTRVTFSLSYNRQHFERYLFRSFSLHEFEESLLIGRAGLSQRILSISLIAGQPRHRCQRLFPCGRFPSAAAAAWETSLSAHWGAVGRDCDRPLGNLREEPGYLSVKRRNGVHYQRRGQGCGGEE